MVSIKHILMLTDRNLAPWVFLTAYKGVPTNLSKIRSSDISAIPALYYLRTQMVNFHT